MIVHLAAIGGSLATLGILLRDVVEDVLDVVVAIEGGFTHGHRLIRRFLKEKRGGKNVIEENPKDPLFLTNSL